MTKTKQPAKKSNEPSQQQAGELQQQLAAAEKTIAELESAVADAQKINETYQQQVGALQQELAAAEKTIAELEAAGTVAEADTAKPIEVADPVVVTLSDKYPLMNSYWRCGFEFTKSPRTLSLAEIGDDALGILNDDAYLDVQLTAADSEGA